MSVGDDSEAESTERVGVEVRVIGGGLKDSRRKAARQSEWMDEETSEDPAEAEEDGGGNDVIRLENEHAPLAVRRVEDVERVTAPDGGRRGLGLGLLTILMGGLAILLVVAGVVFVMSLRKEPVPPSSDVRSPVVAAEDPGFSDEEFLREHADAKSLASRATELGAAYFGAESPEDFLSFVRNREAIEPVIREKWVPSGVSGVFEGTVEITPDHFDGRDLVMISGLDQDSNPFRLFFLESDDRLELDWEASTGLGEDSFADLKQKELGDSAALRIIAERSNYHPVEFPDDEFRCYRLEAADEEQPIFGYVRIGSEVLASMMEAFHENSSLFGPQRKIPLIIEITNRGQAVAGQFEITKVIQEGWIEP